jgi:hypothetical protein
MLLDERAKRLASLSSVVSDPLKESVPDLLLRVCFSPFLCSLLSPFPKNLPVKRPTPCHLQKESSAAQMCHARSPKQNRSLCMVGRRKIDNNQFAQEVGAGRDMHGELQSAGLNVGCVRRVKRLGICQTEQEPGEQLQHCRPGLPLLCPASAACFHSAFGLLCHGYPFLPSFPLLLDDSTSCKKAHLSLWDILDLVYVW